MAWLWLSWPFRLQQPGHSRHLFFQWAGRDHHRPLHRSVKVGLPLREQPRRSSLLPITCRLSPARAGDRAGRRLPPQTWSAAVPYAASASSPWTTTASGAGRRRSSEAVPGLGSPWAIWLDELRHTGAGLQPRCGRVAVVGLIYSPAIRVIGAWHPWPSAISHAILWADQGHHASRHHQSLARATRCIHLQGSDLQLLSQPS
mmetsp:Transcript_62280/g.148670  ORF Transcript_62280/g.148670 Transcript_62280/m.148670 type:complete len:202 (-) Transcript_62280:12-617(-)